MQLVESNCIRRGCAHYGKEDRETPDGIMDDQHTCRAFPNGIPDSISYGNNKHLKPMAGDHGFQFVEGDK